MNNPYFEMTLKFARQLSRKTTEVRKLRRENEDLKAEIARLKELYKPDFDEVNLED